MFWFKTIDGVLESFNKNVEDLNTLAEQHRETAAKRRVQAGILLTQADQHESESTRATRISKKLLALIS